MDTARSHVADRESNAGRNLARCAQIPLHHIAALRSVFDIGGGTGRRSTGRLQKSPGWKGTRRKDISEYPGRERKRKRCDQGECVGQRQYIENAKAAPDRRLVIGRRIPGKTNARFEVTKRRVQKVGGAEVWFGVRQMKQVREPVVRLGRDRSHLIAEARVDGQISPDTDIILNVRAEEGLANPKRRYGNRKQSDEISRPVR